MADLAALIRRAMESKLVDMHVATVGEVVTYYPQDHTADIQPLVKRVIPAAADRTEVVESFPVLTKVPVARIGGKGFLIDCPLEAGDQVTVLFCDSSLEVWWSTGRESDPGDIENHGLSGAIALPLVMAQSDAVTGEEDNLTIGKSGGLRMSFKTDTIEVGASGLEFVALAEKVRAELDAIGDKLNNHTHSHVLYPSGTGYTGTMTASTPPTAAYVSSDVGSTKLKAEG